MCSQYYMPPYSMVTAPYLKLILKGEKKLLKASVVKVCNPPKYDEISVKQIYDACIQLLGMADHLTYGSSHSNPGLSAGL